MDGPSSPDLEALAKGLWGRLRDVLLVAERIERFSFRSGEEEPERAAFSKDEADAIAVDFVLRALHAAADRTAWVILERAAGASKEGIALDALAEETGLPRLVVSERVNDLLQLGLAARALDIDRVHATEAGEQTVRLVRTVAARLAERVGRSDRAEGESQGRGLPVL